MTTGSADSAAFLPSVGSDATVHGAFSSMAKRCAESIALSAGPQRRSYRELDEASNRLARALMARGAAPGSVVALICDRGIDMVAAWLAVLKAGAAYLPIDPDLPAPSRDAILTVGAPAVVLTSGRAAMTGALTLGEAMHLAQAESAGPIAELAGPESPAYVMFTSGTTGRPKGVVVPHRGILRLVRGQTYARLDRSTVILQLAAPSFDASTFEVYGALLNGGRLEVYDHQAVSLDAIAAAVAQGGVNTLWLTAGLFNLFAETGIGSLAGLSQLLAGGDVLSPQHLRTAMAALPGCRFINGYGPTENTTFTCCYPVPSEGWSDGPTPIGPPIVGTTIHILGEDGAPVPPGEPGMLWTGGEGVALGYLNDPVTTAERFKPDPFAGHGLMYSTGDMARLRADGALEFLGRRDREVKIDGRRVSLDAVEHLLRADIRIEDAHVVARDDVAAGRRLIAFVKPSATTPPGFAAQLRRDLALNHPAHLLPSEIVAVKSFPLNSNGKVDRLALGEATRRQAAPPRPHAAADASISGTVAAVFSELLGTDAYDPRRNFFDAGISSLMMAKAHAQIVARTGRRFDIAEMFSCGTVAELSRRLERPPQPPAGPPRLAQDARERALRARAVRPPSRPSLPRGTI